MRDHVVRSGETYLNIVFKKKEEHLTLTEAMEKIRKALTGISGVPVTPYEADGSIDTRQAFRTDRAALPAPGSTI